MFLVVVIQEIVSTTLNRSGGNELQLITKMPMCNIEMGVFMSFFFKVCRQKKPVITNHLDDEGIFFNLLKSYEGFGVWDFRRLFLFGS